VYSTIEIDFNSKRETLDKQGLEIAEQREKSSNARKKLSQETKVFKKLKESEKAAKFAKLLKSYQEEIDNLTKRALGAENAFLELYKELREAPDPYEALNLALNEREKWKQSNNHNNNISNTSINKNEDVEQLKQQLKNYEEEFKYLKDQEVKIHQLEKKLMEYETGMSKRVEKELEEKERKWIQEQEEFLTHYKEKENLLTSQLIQVRQELEDMQQLYENSQNELFNIKSKNEEVDAQQYSQFKALNEEISQLNNTIVSLQSENEILKEKLKKPLSQHMGAEVIEDELISAQREAQMKQLQQNVLSLQSMLEQMKNKSDILQKQLNEANIKILSLEHALSKRPTDEAFNQLHERARMLEELSFSSIITNPDQIRTKSIEQLLAEKNRHLEDQITHIKRLASEREQQLNMANDELIQLRQKTSDQSKLIEKLENDLASHDNNALKGVDTSNSLSIGSNTPGIDEPNVPPQSTSKDQEKTIFQIVSEQRNRFKKRLVEMEEQNQMLNQKIEQLQNNLSSLEKDNVSLYEKIRYLQSYNSNVSSSEVWSSPTMEHLKSSNLRSSNSGGYIDLEDPIGDKYKKLYEQKLDPFKQFHKKEKNSEYKKLTAAEKITYSMTRLMMAHKYSRLFVFFYAVALHLLVFLVSYKLAHQPICSYRNL
jgi:homeobox protein cut-like